jgi:pilus assembly protein FimV
MKIAVRRILLLSALLSPTALYALGLGDIRLKSALNQPFDAEIQLVDATAEDLAALRASIASNDTFARYGLDRPAYLSEFTFSVDRNTSGQEVLRVSSPRPVTEPFVTFLVDANWPRGRLLREYTVLLDPPVYAPGPAVAETPVATPRATTAAPPPAPTETYAPPVEDRTAPAEDRAPSAEYSAPRASAGAASGVEPGSTYRVQANDTLWGIASDAYPGTRSDVNRAMLAIYQANPQAFDGNINVLREGSELAIPGASTVAAISTSEAAAEVSRQYRQWREGSTAGGEAEARLKLVTPQQGSAAASTTPPSAATPGAESSALQARVQQLEAELAEARRLLEVRNAELASLQGQAVPTTPAEPAPAAPDATAGEPVAEEAPVDAAPVAEPPVAEPAPAPVAEETKPAPQVEPTPAPNEPEPSLLDRVMQYWWALAALILLLLAFLFFRRRRQLAEGPDTFDEVFTPGGDLRERPVKLPPRGEGDILVEEKRPIEAPPPRPRPVPVAAGPAEVEPARKVASLDDTLSNDAAVSTEAGDPLAEADFHMAYGLYDQAADLVQLAIKREPQRRDLRLKLLEIFFVWGNRDRFLEVAREMYPERTSMSAGEWDKVLIMGKQIAPEDSMFSQATGAGPTSVDMELAATQQLTDLDFLAEGPESTATDIDLDKGPEEGADSTGIDFILDEPLRGADLASLAPTVESQMFDPSAVEPTQEVALENLGLDVEELGGLEDEDLFAPASPAQVEDTVERPHPSQVEDTVERPMRRSQVDDTVERPVRRARVEDTVEHPAAVRSAASSADADDTHRRPAVKRETLPVVEEEEEDTLNQTGITRGGTQTLKIVKAEETGIIPMLDSTGELPTIESTGTQPASSLRAADFGLSDEPATMSEVGTKLDLARAYIDMGDPEGARSILEEVLQEGSNTQKQEAQRLMSSLP